MTDCHSCFPAFVTVPSTATSFVEKRVFSKDIESSLLKSPRGREIEKTPTITSTMGTIIQSHCFLSQPNVRWLSPPAVRAFEFRIHLRVTTELLAPGEGAR